MSQQNVEAVQHLFAAVVARDQAALCEAYHPDIVIHEAPSMPYGGDYHGHAGALQHVQGYYQTWDPLRPPAWQRQPPLFLDTAEDYVVVLWREEAVEAGSGSKVNLPALGIFKVRDDQVIESRMFQDTAAVQHLRADARSHTP